MFTLTHAVYKNAEKAFILLVKQKPLLRNTFFPLQSFFVFNMLGLLIFASKMWHVWPYRQ